MKRKWFPLKIIENQWKFPLKFQFQIEIDFQFPLKINEIILISEWNETEKIKRREKKMKRSNQVLKPIFSTIIELYHNAPPPKKKKIVTFSYTNQLDSEMLFALPVLNSHLRRGIFTLYPMVAQRIDTLLCNVGPRDLIPLPQG